MNRVCHPGGHYRNYNFGARSLIHCNSTWVPIMKQKTLATKLWFIKCSCRSNTKTALTMKNSMWSRNVIWRQVLGQHQLGQRLVVWWHQAITWTNAVLSSKESNVSHLRAISQVLLNLMHNMHSEITLLNNTTPPRANAGLILDLHPTSHYKVTPFLIGWAQTSNQPCNELNTVLL